MPRELRRLASDEVKINFKRTRGFVIDVHRREGQGKATAPHWVGKVRGWGRGCVISRGRLLALLSSQPSTGLRLSLSHARKARWVRVPRGGPKAQPSPAQRTTTTAGASEARQCVLASSTAQVSDEQPGKHMCPEKDNAGGVGVEWASSTLGRRLDVASLLGVKLIPASRNFSWPPHRGASEGDYAQLGEVAVAGGGGRWPSQGPASPRRGSPVGSPTASISRLRAEA